MIIYENSRLSFPDLSEHMPMSWNDVTSPSFRFTRLCDKEFQLLKAFSKGHGFNIGFDRCCVNKRRDHIESDVVTNEPCRCKRSRSRMRTVQYCEN